MKVISGGQTGVDRAALDAATAAGLDYGGSASKERKAEGWLELIHPHVLNVSGPRESKSPGIYTHVLEILSVIFRNISNSKLSG